MANVNLPAATGSGKEYTIANDSGSDITLDGDGAETIDGAATYDIPDDRSITVVDYASGKWAII